MQVPGFCDSSYQSRAVSAIASRCMNLFPERIEQLGGKNSFVLHGAPGYSLFEDTDAFGITSPQALHVERAAVSAFDRLFCLVAGHLHEYGSDGSLLFDHGDCSDSVALRTRGAVASNGQQLLISANSSNTLFVFDLSTHALTGPIANVTGTMLAYKDGYFLAASEGAQTFQISALMDGETWDPLDFAAVESHPDNLVGMEALSGYVWFFGLESIQAFVNTGNADFPFEPVQGAVLPMGVLFGSVARVARSLYFCCRDAFGGIAVYRIVSGTQVERISTHPIEAILQSVENPASAFAIGYTDTGHEFYGLALEHEDGSSPTPAVYFDTTTNRWHERSSYSKEDADFNGLPLFDYAYAWDRHIVLVDSLRGIFELSMDIFTDAIQVKRDAADNPQGRIRRIRRTPYLSAQTKNLFFKRFLLDMDTGEGNASDPNPTIEFCWSQNGGRTFTDETPRRMGTAGDFEQPMEWPFRTKGKSPILQVSTEAMCRISLTNAYLPDIEVAAW